MKQQLLLLEDVEGLGRSGDIVSPRPGHARNYLLPQKKAVLAGKSTLRLQEKLQEERRLRAKADREQSEAIAGTLSQLVLEFSVKVDPEKNMYGSVTVFDLIKKAEEKGVSLDKKSFPAHYTIKTLGKKKVPLRLNEGVEAFLHVEVCAEGQQFSIEETASAEGEEADSFESQDQEEEVSE